MDEFKRPPDFINEIGVKWWVESIPTDYARRPDPQGTVLEDVACYLIELTDGTRTRGIVKGKALVFQNTSLEAIGIHIEALKMLKRSESKE